MSPRTKKQFEEIRSNRQLELLESALVLFAEKGYQSASIEQIAKHAGVSKGLLYNYFDSKEDILLKLIYELLHEAEAIFQINSKEPIDEKKFKKYVSDCIDIVLNDTRRWKLFFSIFIQPKVLPLLMEKVMDRAKPFMIAFTKYFKKKGYENPEEVMRYFSAVIDGVQMHCMIDPEGFPVETAKKMIIKQFG